MLEVNQEKLVSRLPRKSYRKPRNRFPYHLLRVFAYVLFVGGIALMIWIPASIFSGKNHQSSALTNSASANSGGLQDAKELLMIGAALGLLGFSLLRVHSQWQKSTAKPGRRR